MIGQNRFVQCEVNGGLSLPLSKFANDKIFADKGYHIGSSFDYFFNKIGVGISAGYFTNQSEALFKTHIKEIYFEFPEQKNSQQSWTTKYLMLGPTFKLSKGHFDFDFGLKFGLAQIKAPNLVFEKEFLSQKYDIFNFTIKAKDFQPAFSTSARFIYQINTRLGLQLKADYISSNFLSKIEHTQTYRNVIDTDNNGNLDDTEYFISQKLKASDLTYLNVVNVNVGMVFCIGKNRKPKEPQESLPSLQKDTLDSISTEEKKIIPTDNAIDSPQSVDPSLVQNDNTTDSPKGVDLPQVTNDTLNKLQTKPNFNTTEKDSLMNKKAVSSPNEVNVKDSSDPTSKTLTKTEINTPKNNIDKNVILNDEKDDKDSLDLVRLSSSYEAPEAKYDAKTAEALYKAGEAYYAVNDFENALPCFNKLKADSLYPRAKYMFALTLCSMGNCDEAKREFKDFARSYKSEDASTLSIIFSSQFEKCSALNKSASENKDKLLTNVKDKRSGKEIGLEKEYKIQFIAIRKPNIDFPRVSKIGQVLTEFFPTMSLYRYTLDGYVTSQSALNDLYKVRKMGYRDAFIAVYENGKRTNTMYHNK